MFYRRVTYFKSNNVEYALKGWDSLPGNGGDYTYIYTKYCEYIMQKRLNGLVMRNYIFY